jgi:hypothetical protein
LFLIVKGLINFCWFLFKWGAVPGAIITAIALPYVYQRVDEGIRCHVERLFAEHYGGLKVTIRSAVRVEGEGIEIRGLSVLEPGAEGPRAAMIALEEVFLRCPTELAEWATSEPQVTEVVVRRPTLRIVRLADGSWNVSRLFPLPTPKGDPPNVTIENGTIEIIDGTRSPPSMWTLRDLTLSITMQDGDEPGTKVRVLRGSLTGDHLHRVDLEGTMSPDRAQWTIGGVVEDLDISPELRDALPGVIAEQLAVLGGFRGRAGLSFRVTSDPSSEPPYRFDVAGEVTQGRMDDPRSPYPLTNVRAKIRASNEGFAVDELFAQGGPSTVRLSCRRAGYAKDSPWWLKAEVRQLELDPRLAAGLPEKLRAIWDKYSPSGRIDADVALVSDGQRLLPQYTEVTVRCPNVAFSYYKFPYRMEHAQGTLVLKNDVLRADMTAYGGDQPVAMTAEIRQPLGSPHGWFEASGKNMPIDKKLVEALDVKHRGALQKLNARGTTDFWVRISRERPGEVPLQHLVLDLRGCSICFEHFPYPLENIQGRIERLPDGIWEFSNLEGANGTGTVACNGRLAPDLRGEKLLSLSLVGKNILLEEELRNALKPAMQRVWNDLKPRGMIDLGTEIKWLVDQKKLDLEVVAEPQSETASIEPKAFPYRMEKLRGTMVYRDGHVSFDKFRAEHGHVTVEGGGYCDFLPDGSWHFHLENTSVDRLRLDRELVQALPSRLRKALVELNPTGPMYLHDVTYDAWQSGKPGDPLQASWDVAVGFQQAGVDCGVKLENMHGGLKLKGQYDGQHFYSLGELAVESLSYKGFQFTEVGGPIWIDDRRVLFGTFVDRREANSGVPNAPQPRPITGRLFGGLVKGDAWVALEQVPSYLLQADLTQADLARFAKETMPGQQGLQGRLGAEIDLRGQGRTLNGLVGRGKVWLRDANVYELPVMIAMLKIVSVREPSPTAFSKADIQFQVRGNHIYLSPIDFNGDAISLLGQGQMDFQSNINLAFHAVVGRNEFRLPLISPLMGEASRQTMTINVEGTLQEPRTSQEVLPGVKQALAQLEAELRPDAPPRPLWPMAREPQPQAGGGTR